MGACTCITQKKSKKKKGELDMNELFKEKAAQYILYKKSFSEPHTARMQAARP
jgi:hypothetical protein